MPEFTQDIYGTEKARFAVWQIAPLLLNVLGRVTIWGRMDVETHIHRMMRPYAGRQYSVVEFWQHAGESVQPIPARGRGLCGGLRST
ncbi:hypothetical protein [Thalassovita mediterranea]|jgi:hypothetical protein|uniref:hypothetical protein n=1 Tax=Thalassovita mediterranea TaxID=340021 RepID=UPI00071C3C8D|nr:hypothetical protein [Thalassovita mediterranea]